MENKVPCPKTSLLHSYPWLLLWYSWQSYVKLIIAGEERLSGGCLGAHRVQSRGSSCLKNHYDGASSLQKRPPALFTFVCRPRKLRRLILKLYSSANSWSFLNLQYGWQNRTTCFHWPRWGMVQLSHPHNPCCTYHKPATSKYISTKTKKVKHWNLKHVHIQHDIYIIVDRDLINVIFLNKFNLWIKALWENTFTLIINATALSAKFFINTYFTFRKYWWHGKC